MTPSADWTAIPISAQHSRSHAPLSQTSFSYLPFLPCVACSLAAHPAMGQETRSSCYRAGRSTDQYCMTKRKVPGKDSTILACPEEGVLYTITISLSPLTLTDRCTGYCFCQSKHHIETVSHEVAPLCPALGRQRRAGLHSEPQGCRVVTQRRHCLEKPGKNQP